MKKNESTEEYLLDHLEEDISESAQAHFDDLQSFSLGEIKERFEPARLLRKIELDPSLNFPISDYSVYKSNDWILIKNPGEAKVRVNFNSELKGSNGLKKAICYYLIPEFHPFGRIRSYRSTDTYARAHVYLENFLFKPNGLCITPEAIKAISTRMVNEALDRARDHGSTRSYDFLYFYIRFWSSLSVQRLIPERYRLNVNVKRIDTKDRHKDVINTIEANFGSWRPFNEVELKSLVEYALLWTGSALEHLVEVKDYLLSSGIAQYSAANFNRRQPDEEFENLFGKKINGHEIVGFIRGVQRSSVMSTNGKTNSYDYFRYNWSRHYAQAIDNVRDGVFILVALVMGMRKRELAPITFDEINKNDAGEWSLDLTRFKTEIDPNFTGKTETLPLPSYIGEKIERFKGLRTVLRHKQYRESKRLLEYASGSRECTVYETSVLKLGQRIGKKLSIESLHIHRFRKTIAEILISKSERNIDLIRMLFGHRTYKMTLRYIARNPYLVEAIVGSMEQHYAAAFADIVGAVKEGSYSGVAADKLAHKITKTNRPELFKGKLLRLTILQYVSHMLQSGEPMYIKRTTIGTYCVSDGDKISGNIPPCVRSVNLSDSKFKVDVSNCDLGCERAVVLKSAKSAIEHNLGFYKSLLVENVGSRAERKLREKISVNQKHLKNLSLSRDCSINLKNIGL